MSLHDITNLLVAIKADNLMSVYARDVRNGDVLLDQQCVIDHSEQDVDDYINPAIMLVPRGTDHDGHWYLKHAVVQIDRPKVHSFD